MNRRKRILLILLPLALLPFFTLTFWALGGGRDEKTAAAKSSGLNLALPVAHFKNEKELDKLGFYTKAAQDSQKKKEWMKADPYYRSELTDIIPSAPGETAASPELMRKLQDLQRHVHSPAAPAQNNESIDIEKLEEVVNSIQQSAETDTEMEQIENTLDKILDIQHPERVREKMKEKSSREIIDLLTVSTHSASDTIVAGFYGVQASGAPQDAPANVIAAAIHTDQVLVEGSAAQLRLLQDIFLAGTCIPRGSFLYGLVALHGERLHVAINSIRYEHTIYPVKMNIFDMDGLAGIRIPGAMTGDAAKQTARNSLQQLDISLPDPSLKTQAAMAGIGAAKTLFARRSRMVSIHLKAGYRVLLKAATH